MFIVDSVLKSNPQAYKIKDLNGEKIIGRFHEKELLQSISEMSYYPEPNNHIRDKVKVVLTCQIMLLKKNQIMLQVLIHLAAKNDLIALKAE